ncbi:MAG: class D sortase [Clostridium sp.]|nr:class D sortase [Clostridium sp.]MCM1547375.1 class D sortase [Ruminococcus sp.]
MKSSVNDNAVKNRTKKQWVLFITGLIAILIGITICGFFCVKKIHREIQKQKLLKENVVVEITDLDIEAPVLEGTDSKTLSKAAGHFSGTGKVGSGNYCIAGHSSTIYKEYFNDLKKADIGMQINLYDKEKKCYTYDVSEKFIVDPDETWVLNDFGDDRITIITCTDDGKQRQVVIGTKSTPET